MAAKIAHVRIAVADDVPGARKIYVRLLEHRGHKVICAASNGAELLDQCSGQQVDVVFTDLDMPVMDGLAAAQELLEKGIPVVLVSGHPDADELVLEHEPVVTCLSKPASLQSLQHAIEQALTGVKSGPGRSIFCSLIVNLAEHKRVEHDALQLSLELL